MPNSALQARTVKVLASAQVLNGLGVAGTVAAGSLLVSSITDSETLAGLAQTFSVLGAAAFALPLARLTARGGRRLALSVGLLSGVIGSGFAILGGAERNIYFMLLGAFLVGSASAASAVTLALATLVIQLFLRPDPFLTAQKNLEAVAGVHRKSTREALAHIRSNSSALFAIAAIAIGHIAMVSVMVMTPVHMKHVDVTLRIIGFVISIHVLGMYAFSPIIGSLSDKVGRVRIIQIGLILLIASTIVAGTAAADDAVQLGIGLFLLGLGWSCTLIAGSALLSESVDHDMKPASQGASDLVMNLSGAGGGALAGLIIGTLSYGWLCLFAAIPVLVLFAISIKTERSRSDVE